jgi:hypothetical protein
MQEIIVRDAHCFHCFNKKLCSCRDCCGCLNYGVTNEPRDGEKKKKKKNPVKQTVNIGLHDDQAYAC